MSENLPWTEARCELLTKEWLKDTTASRIAELLGGTTRCAVVGKAHRLGLPGRDNPIKGGAAKAAEGRRAQAARARFAKESARVPKEDWWTDDRLAILRAGYDPETARPPAEIAAELGCSLDRLYDKVRELGLVHPTRAQRSGIAVAPGTAAVTRTMSERLAAHAPKVAPDSLNLRLDALKPSSCRYPTSAFDAREHTFCGADTGVPGSPYCPFHHGICFTRPAAPQQQAAE